MPPNDSTQQIQYFIESLLENESLTSNLDDTAANVLLDWGIACANLIGRQHSDLAPVDAEAVMYPQLRATRKLMRLVNRWVPQRLEMDSGGNAGFLTSIFDHASIIYGEDFQPPTAGRKEAFLTQSLSKTAPQFIADLQQLVEDHNRVSSTNPEGKDG